MTPKILLDSNIILYTSDTSNPFYRTCMDFILHATQFCLVDRSLLEIYRTLTGSLKRKPKEALEIIDFYQNNLNYTILSATDFSNQLTFKLAGETNAISRRIFDSNILAVALENEVEILYTKNLKDYPNHPDIQILDPTL